MLLPGVLAMLLLQLSSARVACKTPQAPVSLHGAISGAESATPPEVDESTEGVDRSRRAVVEGVDR